MVKKETTLNEIGETLVFIVANMATKDDVRAIIHEIVPGIVDERIREVVPGIVTQIIDEKLQPIIGELVSIRRELSDLKQKAANNSGLSKEIDYVLTRVVAIEKHLGLDKTVAA